MALVLPILAALIGAAWAICAWLVFKPAPIQRKARLTERPRRRPNGGAPRQS